MQTIQLGKTDLIVSRICFGCWQLSPKFWGEVPLGPWREAIKKALDVGVNFIDTADAYGDGYAESSLGDFLAKEGLRDRFVIATKFYWNFEREKRYPDTSHDYIIRECEASLKRLKTDRIDLYQIHAWDPLIRPDEVAAAFGQLKKQGKVRWFGVSNWNADQIRMGLEHFDIECLQPRYSLLTREIEERELPLCLGKRIGVIAFSSLYRGLLTGKYPRDHKFTDTRADLPLFQGKAFQRMMDAMDDLKPFAEKHGLTLPQLAIRWILTHPALSCAIVGIKTAEHIETIAPAGDAILPSTDWWDIADIIETAEEEAKKAD
ncbi:MAG: aldo/keto reductase [Planctomycetes bacterium]|nr:aldo/keto reductase [Planctomycetota bacterium]